MATAIINADRALSIFISTAWFPTIGKEGVLYFAQDVEETYRWDVNSGTYVLFAATDHGLLTGLADDDHPQYALDTDLDGYQPLHPAQPANTVYAGPASGAAATPTFRGIVYPDFASSTFVSVSGSTQAIPADAFTALIFPTKTSDTLGEYNTTTGVFIPQNTGLYLVWVSAESTTAGIVDQRILVSLATAAGIDGNRILNAYTNSAASLDVSAAKPVSMTGGTAYYFNMYCSSAETLSGGESCAMAIKRIG